MLFLVLPQNTLSLLTYHILLVLYFFLLLIFATCHCFSEQNEPFCYQASTLPLYHVCTSIVVYDTSSSSDVTFQDYSLLATTLSLLIGLHSFSFLLLLFPTGKSTLAMLKASGARYLLSVPSILEDIL